MCAARGRLYRQALGQSRQSTIERWVVRIAHFGRASLRCAGNTCTAYNRRTTLCRDIVGHRDRGRTARPSGIVGTSACPPARNYGRRCRTGGKARVVSGLLGVCVSASRRLVALATPSRARVLGHGSVPVDVHGSPNRLHGFPRVAPPRSRELLRLYRHLGGRESCGSPPWGWLRSRRNSAWMSRRLAGSRSAQLRRAAAFLAGAFELDSYLNGHSRTVA